MSEASFRIRELRDIVSDLFTPNPAIYWLDFGISVVLGYSAAAFYIRAPLFSVQQFLAMAVAITFIYRISLFMHEISHFRKGEFRTFKVVWNLVAGIPLLTPSFFYETHLEHHNTRHYGTEHDGEYLPLVSGGWRRILLFLLQPFYLPILTIVRFLIVTPLSFLIPGLRRWALEHWSSFVIDLKFKRDIRAKDPVKLWAWIEAGCFLRAIALFAVGLPPLSLAPWYQFLLIYALAVSILILNHLRTLAAHRYRGDGKSMSHADQLFDSTDIVGDPILTEILCPVGLRFHALHHLFPGMPYHNLKKAHLRLMEKLPEDSPYRACVYPHYFAVMKDFLIEVNERRRLQKHPLSDASHNSRTNSGPRFHGRMHSKLKSKGDSSARENGDHSASQSNSDAVSAS